MECLFSEAGVIVHWRGAAAATRGCITLSEFALPHAETVKRDKMVLASFSSFLSGPAGAGISADF